MFFVRSKDDDCTIQLLSEHEASGTIFKKKKKEKFKLVSGEQVNL